MPDISPSEFFAISRELEQHHAIFYQLWELGRPVFTDSIPTAAVSFNKEGRCINFLFNPAFWDGLSPRVRAFVICHECLHVLLRHGVRTKNCEHSNREAVNIALDIVVNHMLLQMFGFDRKEVDPENKLCWIETIFPGRTDILPGQSFEYYYTRLPDGMQGMQTMLVDAHDFLDGSESEFAKDGLAKSITPQEAEDMQGKLEEVETNVDVVGKNSPGAVQLMGRTVVAAKPKWETVIKKWSLPFCRTDFDIYEHWARVNRRLVMIPDDAMLPNEMELQDKEERGRIRVYFFLDTSGSCASLAPRFWKAAKSLPKARFDRELFCFDTKIYPISAEDEETGKLRGFGGTSFSAIENFIQQDMKVKKRPYPDAIFVISDGYGDAYSPQNSKAWYWFLAERGSKAYITAGSKVFRLKDFE